MGRSVPPTRSPILLRHLLACAACVLLAAQAARGEQFLFEGPAAMGMGGAGVASVEDSSAVYWNPAILATLDERSDLSFEFNLLGDQEGNLVQEADEIARLIEKLEAGGTGSTFDELITRLNDGTASAQDLQDALEIITEFSDLAGKEVGIVVQQSGHMRITPLTRFGDSPFILGLSLGERLIGEITGRLEMDLLASALANQSTATAGFTNVFAGVGGSVDRTWTVGSPEESLADELEIAILNSATGPITIAEADAFADELVFQALAANVDISDPEIRAVLQAVVEATAGATGTSSTELISKNRSGVTIQGIAIIEATLSLAAGFMDNRINFGINARMMRGQTYLKVFNFDSFDTGNITVKDDLLDYSQSVRYTTQFGFDIGVMWEPVEDRLRLGLVGRNLNSPSFKVIDDPITGNPRPDFELNPQVRIGAAVYAGGKKRWTFAADVDLVASDSQLIKDLSYQSVSLGARVKALPWWTISAGVTTDFSTPETKFLWTGGMTFKLGKFVHLSVAGGVTANPRNVEFTLNNSNPSSFPEAIGLSGSLSIVKPF